MKRVIAPKPLRLFGASTYAEDRKSSHERGYTRQWANASRIYRILHPLCECDECRELEREIPSEVVDHKIPHRGNQALFWDQKNWQAMSKACHDRKTARGL